MPNNKNDAATTTIKLQFQELESSCALKFDETLVTTSSELAKVVVELPEPARKTSGNIYLTDNGYGELASWLTIHTNDEYSWQKIGLTPSDLKDYVSTLPQAFTDEQKRQARENIGVILPDVMAIKVNGTTITPDEDKAVNIQVALPGTMTLIPMEDQVAVLPLATQLEAGLVKSSDEENTIYVHETGIMEVNNVNVSKLSTHNTEFIIDDGDSTFGGKH